MSLDRSVNGFVSLLVRLLVFNVYYWIGFIGYIEMPTSFDVSIVLWGLYILVVFLGRPLAAFFKPRPLYAVQAVSLSICIPATTPFLKATPNLSLIYCAPLGLIAAGLFPYTKAWTNQVSLRIEFAGLGIGAFTSLLVQEDVYMDVMICGIMELWVILLFMVMIPIWDSPLVPEAFTPLGAIQPLVSIQVAGFAALLLQSFAWEPLILFPFLGFGLFFIDHMFFERVSVALVVVCLFGAGTAFPEIAGLAYLVAIFMPRAIGICISDTNFVSVFAALPLVLLYKCVPYNPSFMTPLIATTTCCVAKLVHNYRIPEHVE